MCTSKGILFKHTLMVYKVPWRGEAVLMLGEQKQNSTIKGGKVKRLLSIHAGMANQM